MFPSVDSSGSVKLERQLEESEPSGYAKLSGSTLFDLKPGTGSVAPLEKASVK